MSERDIYSRMVKILLSNGYHLERSSKSSHSVYKNPDKPYLTVTINSKLNRMVAKRLIKENGLSGREVDDFKKIYQ